MYKNNSLFIDNKWVKSNSNDFFVYKNLKNINIKIVSPHKEELKNLTHSSKKAQNIWKKKTNLEKAKIIKFIASLIIKNKKIIAKKEMFDTGKTFKQALEEVEYCYKLWIHASKIVLKFNEKKIRINKKTFCKIYNEPIGITSIIVPWNFPFIVLSERLPYILASGCVAIIKPSEYASGTLIKFADILCRNKIPEGIINLITGGPKIGSDLVGDKNIRCISFTGSSITGKRVMKKASTDLKRLSLELGGKNPIIIFKDSNLKKSVENVFTSFTHNSGQCCVGASRVFIEEEIFEKFKTIFKKILIKDKNIYQISNSMQYEKIFSYLNQRKFSKKNIFYGKIPLKKNLKLQVQPIVFKDLNPKDNIHNTELFSPVITLESFKNETDVKNLIDESNYGLACMVWTKNLKKAQNFIKGIQIGRLWVNGNIKQNYPNIPIGGFKWSGIGRETGSDALQNYSESK